MPLRTQNESEHAGGEGEAVEGDLLAVRAGLLDEAHDLQADDRKDAGHQVEDQAAEQHAAEDREEGGEIEGARGGAFDGDFGEQQGGGSVDGVEGAVRSEDAGEGGALLDRADDGFLDRA